MRKQVMEYNGPDGLVGARIEPLPEGCWIRTLGSGRLCLLLDKDRFCVFEIHYHAEPDDVDVILQSDPIEVRHGCIRAGICTAEEYEELSHAAQARRRAEIENRELTEYRRLRNKYGLVLEEE